MGKNHPLERGGIVAKSVHSTELFCNQGVICLHFRFIPTPFLSFIVLYQLCQVCSLKVLRSEYRNLRHFKNTKQFMILVLNVCNKTLSVLQIVLNEQIDFLLLLQLLSYNIFFIVPFILDVILALLNQVLSNRYLSEMLSTSHANTQMFKMEKNWLIN